MCKVIYLIGVIPNMESGLVGGILLCCDGML